MYEWLELVKIGCGGKYNTKVAIFLEMNATGKYPQQCNPTIQSRHQKAALLTSSHSMKLLKYRRVVLVSSW